MSQLTDRSPHIIIYPQGWSNQRIRRYVATMTTNEKLFWWKSGNVPVVGWHGTGYYRDESFSLYLAENEPEFYHRYKFLFDNNFTP